MREDKEAKVYYLDTMPGFKHNRKTGDSGFEGHLMSKVSPLKRKETEPFMDTLEEELELEVGLYSEIKKISKKTGRSFQKIVESALEDYIESYRKAFKK